MMVKLYLTLSFLLGVLLVAQAHGHAKEIGFYQLKGGNLKLNLTNYGATIVSVVAPDKHGMFYSVSCFKCVLLKQKSQTFFSSCLSLQGI